MKNIIVKKIIENILQEWIIDDNKITPASINSGLCADFSYSVNNKIDVDIFGIYDKEDCLKFSDDPFWLNLFSKDVIGHTFFKFNDLYYDSEEHNGVSDVFKLPYFKRAKIIYSLENFININEVYHVGNLDYKNHSKYSYEANGISVSIHPDKWRKVAKLKGDNFLLKKNNGIFLNSHLIDKNIIEEWC